MQSITQNLQFFDTSNIKLLFKSKIFFFKLTLILFNRDSERNVNGSFNNIIKSRDNIIGIIKLGFCCQNLRNRLSKFH